MYVRKNKGKERDGIMGGQDRTHLEIGEAHDTPEVLEDGDLRYRCGMETRDALSGWGIRLINESDHDDTRARGHQEKIKIKQKKTEKGQLCVPKPETGKKHLRGEWNTVVDGYQAVEHERCFFFPYKE